LAASIKGTQPPMTNNNHTLDIPTIENWLWEAACSIRGPLDAPKYKDYILPLLFYKRLCDVFDDELERLGEEFGDAELARQLVQADRTLTRAYIPSECCWTEIRRSPARLGERLTDAMREIGRQNPRLQAVVGCRARQLWRPVLPITAGRFRSYFPFGCLCRLGDRQNVLAVLRI